jgi:type I restriction enzyme, S subunit
MTSIKRLDEVCEIIMGQAPSGEAYNVDGNGWPLLAGASDFGESAPRPKKYTTQASKVSKIGDIILGIRASIGQKVVSDGEYCLGRGVAALRPREALDARFLRHWLTHITPELVGKAKGATFKQVNREDIGELQIALIPLSQQRRIAGQLDQVEELGTKRREAASLLDNLIQPIFLDMFGDPTTNSHNWPSIPLSRLVRDGDSINYGVIQPGNHFDQGVPLIRIGDLIGGRVDKTSIKRISPDIEGKYRRSRIRGYEVLVSCVGSIGQVALADNSVSGFNIARAVARLPLDDNCNCTFISQYLRTDFVQSYFSRESRTVSQPTLNIKQLAETTVLLPPLKLQQEFASRVDSIKRLKDLHHAHLAELDALFASLQYRAFRGEL